MPHWQGMDLSKACKVMGFSTRALLSACPIVYQLEIKISFSYFRLQSTRVLFKHAVDGLLTRHHCTMDCSIRISVGCNVFTRKVDLVVKWFACGTGGLDSVEGVYAPRMCGTRNQVWIRCCT